MQSMLLLKPWDPFTQVCSTPSYADGWLAGWSVMCLHVFIQWTDHLMWNGKCSHGSMVRLEDGNCCDQGLSPDTEEVTLQSRCPFLFFIITCYNVIQCYTLLQHYYNIITSSLHSLLHSLLHIIMSLLPHYYIITSYYTSIITCYWAIIT
jgi:hypothetical protein